MTGRTVTYGYERARAVAPARGAVALGGTEVWLLVLGPELLPLLGHVGQGLRRLLLAEVRLVQLGPAEDVPGAVVGGHPLLGPGQVRLLLEHVDVGPFAEGGADLLVAEQRGLGEAQPLLERPALGDPVVPVGLAAEVVEEVPGRGHGL